MTRLDLKIIVSLFSVYFIDILQGGEAFSIHRRCSYSPSVRIHTPFIHISQLYYRVSHDEIRDEKTFSCSRKNSHRLVDAVLTVTKVVNIVIQEASEIDKLARKGIGTLKGKEIYELDDLRKDVGDSILKATHFIKTKDYSLEAKILDEMIHLLRRAQYFMLDSKENELFYQQLEDWDRRLLEETITPMKEWQTQELGRFEKLSSQSEKAGKSSTSSTKIQTHVKSLEKQKKDFDKRHAEMEMIASSISGRMQRQREILEQNGYVWNHLDS